MNSLSWMVGLRYLSARKGSTFVSLFSLASILGMAVSVMAMVLVLSVMNGFEGEMRNRILHAMPHGQVTSPAGLDNWHALATALQRLPHVQAVAPQDRARVLLTSNDKVHGAELSGVDPVMEATVSEIDKYLVSGSWRDLHAGGYGAVVGQSLARQLHVDVGDSITVMLPRVSVTPLGLFPRSRRFTVVGIFSVGAQLDSTQLYIHLDDASRLLRYGNRVDALQIRFDDVMHAPDYLQTLRTLSAFTHYELKSWRDENSTLFNAMRMEKFMVSLMLLVIIAVSVFNLVSILTMAVADRRMDIAVLRTIGASRQLIMAIFLIYGMAMSAIGIGIGVVAGSLLALKLGVIMHGIQQLTGVQFIDPQVFFVADIPSDWHWQQAAAIALLALLLCLFAVFYPAWRASTIQPAEALRYE